MKGINRAKAERFVNHNANTYITLTSLKNLRGAFAAFAFFGLSGTQFTHTRVWSISLISLAILYTLGVSVYRNRSNGKASFPLRFLISGITMLALSICLLLFSSLLLGLSRSPAIACIIPWVCYILCVVLHYAVVINNIKRDRYRGDLGISSNPVTMGILVSAIAGVSLGRVLREQLSALMGIYMAITLFCIVSFICAGGTIHFLKYYYTQKYNITCDQWGNASSRMLICPKPKRSRFQKIVWISVLVLILSCILLGVLGTIFG